MNKTLSLLAAVAGVAFAAPSFAAEESYESKVKVEKDADGDMTKKVTEESTDASGKVKTETKAEVDVDANGTEKTVTTKTVNDPKGLMNKTTTKTEDKVHKDGTHTHTKKVNGKKVEETTTKQ